MLKPSDPSRTMPAPPDERPVGELVHDLVENGKAYAQAEVALAKATAMSKAKKLRLPAILGFSALLLLQAAINVLGVAVMLGLALLIGPILAGVLAFLVIAGISGALAWVAVNKFREAL